MPTVYKRKYQKRPPTGTLTEDQLSWLADGWCLDGTPAYIDALPFETLDAARAAWELHRAEVIAEVHAVKGKRARLIPESWWRFESTEGLKQLAGPKPRKPVELWRGEPRMWASAKVSASTRFETEAKYLTRLGISRATLRRKEVDNAS